MRPPELIRISWIQLELEVWYNDFIILFSRVIDGAFCQCRAVSCGHPEASTTTSKIFQLIPTRRSLAPGQSQDIYIRMPGQ